ncbi:MAG: hypothetical protein GY832_23660 [Chloroflexi bacterium]|nr:hypothetical protein [Chloroflexota bacterium]
MKDIKTIMREAGEATEGEWESDGFPDGNVNAPGNTCIVYQVCSGANDVDNDGVANGCHIANMDPPTTQAWGAALVEVMEWAAVGWDADSADGIDCESPEHGHARAEVRAILSRHGLRLGGE